MAREKLEHLVPSIEKLRVFCAQMKMQSVNTPSLGQLAQVAQQLLFSLEFANKKFLVGNMDIKTFKEDCMKSIHNAMPTFNQNDEGKKLLNEIGDTLNEIDEPQPKMK